MTRGPKKPVPETELAKLIHDYLGPRTYSEVARAIRAMGYERSDTAVRFCCQGKAGSNADYTHRGMRSVSRIKHGKSLDEPSTLMLVVEVLGIPVKKITEALRMDLERELLDIDWAKTGTDAATTRIRYFTQTASDLGVYNPSFAATALQATRTA